MSFLKLLFVITAFACTFIEVSEDVHKKFSEDVHKKLNVALLRCSLKNRRNRALMKFRTD